MDKSGSQKFLKVISIIEIVLGALLIIVGLLSIAGGTVAGTVDSATLAEQGLTEADRAAGAAALSLVGAFSAIAGIISIIEGVLGVRAANDPSKIMPVWVLALISLVCAGLSLLMGIFGIAGMSFGPSSILTVVMDALMFWVANNIKNQN